MDGTDYIETLKRFYNIFKLIFMPVDKCLSFKYVDFVKEIKQEISYLAWFYQTCSEFGWYQTTDSKEQPFGSNAPVDLSLKLCQDVYGDM